MEVVKGFSASLSNYEVFRLLQSIPYNKQTLNNLATITYQTVKYLEDTPCKKLTPEKIREFLIAVEPFKLAKSEKLMLLNICPSTPLEIQFIIEDSEERLSEEEVTSLLEIIANLREDEQSTEQS